MMYGKSSHLQKNLKTFLSLSKNYFWDTTLPPPSAFSKNSFISLSFLVGTTILDLAKLSVGTSRASGCDYPMLYKNFSYIFNIDFYLLTLKNSLVYWSQSKTLIDLPRIPTSRPTLKSVGSNGVFDPSCLSTIYLFKN